MKNPTYKGYSSSFCKKIAYPYAMALYQLACSQHTLKETTQALKTLYSALHHKDIALQVQYLLSPASTKNHKERFCQTLTHIHPLITKTLLLLLQTNRLFCLIGLIEAFQNIVFQKEGGMQVTVNSAYPLSEPNKQKITTFVKNHCNAKQVTIKEHLTPSLLSGCILYFSTYRLDLSLKGKLRKLQQA